MTEEEYGSFPKYRTHHPIDWDHHSDKHQKMNVLQYGVEKRVNNGQGAFRNSKRPSWSHGGRFGNNYAVYRCHNGNFAEYKASKNNDLRDIDTKKTMQSLNGRLTSYLENVKLLEEENVQLEQKICDWYKKNEGGFVFPDCSQYLEMITDLQSQVLSAREQNADLSQKMEDYQMTAEGYRKSHEMEHRMRTNAEEELYKHYRIQGMINQDSQDLGEHVQNLKKELLGLKKTSEEEITGLQAQLGTRVNVEVETAPSIDLNATLCRIRNEYETLMERNLNDIEKMHQEMIFELSREVFSGIEQLQLSNNEVTGLKLRMLTLETELKKEWSLVS
ncbi:keratin, type I cuticular Ha6-like [Hyla sarda]|uniref:keratin, type I cuticular Ha6-like n=1 Tax=Hyla sarda TaxID=327740 RepID=UPI0024C36598|nr:keratin, type I cuticular Ha6-like [Hyla sarda]